MSSLTEQNIIGCLLICDDDFAISKVYTKIKPEMFESPFYGSVYNEYCKAYDTRQKIDIVILKEKLRDCQYNDIVIDTELQSALENTVTSANIGEYADLMVKDYKARQLGAIVDHLQISSDDIYKQIGELLTDIEALQSGQEVKYHSLAELVDKYKDEYFCDREKKKVSIGFRALDDVLGGLDGGEMIVIAARPSVGKSALVTQIASNMSRQGKKVGFFNLEMSDQQMFERFLVAESGIGLTRIKRALAFQGEEKEKFEKACATIKEKDKNLIITTGGMSIGQVRTQSRHMGYDIIIIDYLQLLNPDTPYKGNRIAEVGAISRSIKSLAMELQIPIIVLSQLNRVSERSETKEPTMAELRESGAIEQDASVIILLWNLDEDRINKGCKIDKNRQGKVGKIELRFNGEMMRFEELKSYSNKTTETTEDDFISVDEETPFDDFL